VNMYNYLFFFYHSLLFPIILLILIVCSEKHTLLWTSNEALPGDIEIHIKSFTSLLSSMLSYQESMLFLSSPQFTFTWPSELTSYHLLAPFPNLDSCTLCPTTLVWVCFLSVPTTPILPPHYHLSYYQAMVDYTD
jgi:hypothetical protein